MHVAIIAVFSVLCDRDWRGTSGVHMVLCRATIIADYVFVARKTMGVAVVTTPWTFPVFTVRWVLLINCLLSLARYLRGF